MQPRNRYYRRAHVSERKFRQLTRFFALDFSATDTAHLTGLTRKSVTTIFLKIRRRIAQECERASPLSSGEVEVDESYFGARRVRGKRGRGASGKTPVFGLLKRDGRVYTEIVPDCRKATLQAIIRGRVAPDTVIHSDGWRGYDGLVDVGYAKHGFVVSASGRALYPRGRRNALGWSRPSSGIMLIPRACNDLTYLTLQVSAAQ